MVNIKINSFATASLNTALNDKNKKTTDTLFDLCDENSPTVTEEIFIPLNF